VTVGLATGAATPATALEEPKARTRYVMLRILHRFAVKVHSTGPVALTTSDDGSLAPVYMSIVKQRHAVCRGTVENHQCSVC
jgi:hypothetical protein